MIDKVHKACPVVLRRRPHLEIMVFRHPLAGIQLVKGGVEVGESVAAACERELLEESGLVAWATKSLGTLPLGEPASVWEFYQMTLEADQLPERWSFDTEDGGGLRFDFFWHRLDQPESADWHSMFSAALAHIRERVSQ
ncbi:NUDIX domain-containing protein [Gilvimarinus algae]|uniref:NUDIX domain-containing protein n=1 Tax=Gilvimarinus algae TaxID=3058037 RepID=A0ABT8THS5_9GAMM|nr:NUDIX domain-containing protein [Gilvimarinus sp. SDUM040014]MDO3383645.1 NUDIX domain-containing protein [Gilvimarinus sp. SDUM040014]